MPPHNSSILGVVPAYGVSPQHPPKTYGDCPPPGLLPACVPFSPPAYRSHPGGCGATARTIPGPGRTVRSAARKRGSDAKRTECCAAGRAESTLGEPPIPRPPRPSHGTQRGVPTFNVTAIAPPCRHITAASSVSCPPTVSRPNTRRKRTAIALLPASSPPAYRPADPHQPHHHPLPPTPSLCFGRQSSGPGTGALLGVGAVGAGFWLPGDSAPLCARCQVSLSDTTDCIEMACCGAGYCAGCLLEVALERTPRPNPKCTCGEPAGDMTRHVTRRSRPTPARTSSRATACQLLETPTTRTTRLRYSRISLFLCPSAFLSFPLFFCLSLSLSLSPFLFPSVSLSLSLCLSVSLLVCFCFASRPLLRLFLCFALGVRSSSILSDLVALFGVCCTRTGRFSLCVHLSLCCSFPVSCYLSLSFFLGYF